MNGVGVITEYSAPSEELVKQMAKPLDNADLDYLREIILEKYKMANGEVDLKKIPLIMLCHIPEFRELYDELCKMKKFLDELD